MAQRAQKGARGRCATWEDGARRAGPGEKRARAFARPSRPERVTSAPLAHTIGPRIVGTWDLHQGFDHLAETRSNFQLLDGSSFGPLSAQLVPRTPPPPPRSPCCPCLACAWSLRWARVLDLVHDALHFVSTVSRPPTLVRNGCACSVRPSLALRPRTLLGRSASTLEQVTDLDEMSCPRPR